MTYSLSRIYGYLKKIFFEDLWSIAFHIFVKPSQIKANMKLAKDGMKGCEDPEQQMVAGMPAKTCLFLLASHQRFLLLCVRNK